VNKSLVNVIGGAVTAGILLLGVLVGALPLWSNANATMKSADDVAMQNQTQQAVLDGLTAQAAELDSVQREVDALHLELPMNERTEDLVEIAGVAAYRVGATLVAVRPADAAAFAPRTPEVVAAETGVELEAAASEPAVDPTTGEAVTEDSGAADAAAVPDPAAAPADGPQQLTVTVEFDAPDVATATALVDALRAGPRLVSVTGVTVQTEDDAVSVTATVQIFFRP
jgi:hypothetical protein